MRHTEQVHLAYFYGAVIDTDAGTVVRSDSVQCKDTLAYGHEYHFQIKLNILMISFLMTEYFMRKTCSFRSFERLCSDLFKINWYVPDD